MALPLVLAGISMAQAFLGNKAQKEAAAAGNLSADEAAIYARRGTEQARADLMAQMGEFGISQNKSKVLRLMQGLRDRAFIKAALAENQGTSRSLQASAFATGADIGALDFSRRSGLGQFERQRQQIEAGLSSQLNQIQAQRAQFQAPSALSSALSIGLAGFTGWSQGKTLEAKYPTSLPAPIPRSIPQVNSVFHPQTPKPLGIPGITTGNYFVDSGRF